MKRKVFWGIALLLPVVPVVGAEPDVGQLYGLDFSTNSLVKNIPTPAKNIQPAQKVDTPVEVKQTALEKLFSKQTPAENASLEVTTEWQDPLVAFCSKSTFGTQDPHVDLKRNVALALGKDEGLLSKIKQTRLDVLEKWTAWMNADRKEEAYAELQRAYQDQLKKNKVVLVGNISSFSEWTLMADFSDIEFTPKMLQRIKGPSYYSLVLSVLGCPQFSSDTGKSRTIDGVALTDMQTLQLILVSVVDAYRQVYDSLFPAACLSHGLAFTRESDEAKQFFTEKMEAEFTGKLSSPNSLDSRWNGIIASARAYAHKGAGEFIHSKLARMAQIITLYSARLEVIRVSNAAFAYPSAVGASKESLSDEGAMSILMGLVYRVGRELLTRNTLSLDSTQIQSLFVQEYQGQQKLGHISDVLVGELVKREAEGEKMRAAFEARCAILFGNVDFLHPLFSSQVPGALSDIDINKGVELYKKLMQLYCQRNGIAWGIVAPSKAAGIKKAALELGGGVRNYLEELGLQVGSSADISAAYSELIALVSGGWAKKERNLFASSRGVTLAGSDIKGNVRVSSNAEVFKGLYKFFWICVGQRLLALVARSGTKEYTPDSEILEEHEQQDVLALQKKEAAVLSKKEEAEKKLEADGLSGSLLSAQKKIVSFSSTMNARAEQLRSDALKFAAGEKGLRDVNAGVLNTLTDSSKFIGGIQEVIESVVEQSESATSRFIATTKAVLIYTHAVGAYAKTKVERVQASIARLAKYLNSSAVSSVVRSVAGGAIKKVLAEVNKDDDVLTARIKKAGADMQLAMQGKKSPSELKLEIVKEAS